MNQHLRRIRRLLWERGRPRVSGCFLRQRRAFDSAVLLVQMFYATNLLWAAWRLAQPTHWADFASLRPLWPLFWAEGLEVRDVAAIVFTSNLAGAVLAAFWPGFGPARCLAFGGVLLAGAFDNSFGKIGHSGHAWVWTAFFLMFLPWPRRQQVAESRLLRQRFLQVFWMTQLVLLFFYSMAGILKLVPVPLQLLQGEASSISPDALARHIASRSLQTGSDPLLAGLLIRHLAISWPLYLGAIFLETAAVVVAFRPVLHRLWGAAIVLLHLGIGLAMEIWFVPSIFLATVFLYHSPFRPERLSWQHALGQLPGIAGLFRLIAEHRAGHSKSFTIREHAA